MHIELQALKFRCLQALNHGRKIGKVDEYIAACVKQLGGDPIPSSDSDEAHLLQLLYKLEGLPQSETKPTLLVQAAPVPAPPVAVAQPKPVTPPAPTLKRERKPNKGKVVETPRPEEVKVVETPRAVTEMPKSEVVEVGEELNVDINNV